MSWSPPPIHIFDTMTNSRQKLVPLHPGEVRIYVCGLTVYDYSHVGHARTFIVFDVVRRYLAYRGYRVVFVRNHTDVDDKIIARANQNQEPPLTLAERFIEKLDEDLDRLNCLPPQVAPRVSQEMPVIIEMTTRLIEAGHGYVVDGDVFYDVDSFHQYGKLSKKVLEDLRAGERVSVDERKRHPYDFALWKATKPGEPKWPSPWGEGRPGWHIECSAMSTHYLGDTLDIHGGGRDLIFPHHENEIAQSEGATGKTFVNYWMHTGPLTVDGEKMSKSLGNFWTVRDILKVHHPDVLRFFLLTAHYRKPIGFSQDGLEEARQRVLYFGRTLERLSGILAICDAIDPEGPCQKPDLLPRYWEEVHAAMDDDFNTPRFLALFHELAKKANDLVPATPRKVKDPGQVRTLAMIRDALQHSGAILGLFKGSAEETLRTMRQLRLSQLGVDLPQVEQLIARRIEARSAKDFSRADEIRQQLKEMGVSLMDSPTGTVWDVD
ncbi:MAG: cysteine--tRNA ligase [Bradymonadales bacterium]|nr:cysteine--tRNA ligase [Bradymonadales bacterium]